MIPESLQKNLNQCRTLPTLPNIALQVMQVARDPEAGIGDLIPILSKDPALAAKVLSTANSAYYSRQRPCDNLTQALNLLGLDMTVVLTLSFAFANTLHQMQSSALDLKKFWKRSVLSAMAVRVLAKGHAQADQLFLAALMQDIGILALHEIDPQTYVQEVQQAQTHMQLVAAEMQTYHCDHAHIGAWLVAAWKLPTCYVDWIGQSHAPGDSLEAKYIYLSGALADLWVREDPLEAMSEVLQVAAESLDLDAEAMQAVIENVHQHLPEAAQIFGVNLEDPIDMLELVQSAKDLLVERNLRLMQQMAHYQQELQQLRSHHAELHQQLQRDPLTQVYNRGHISQLLEHAYQQAKATQTPLTLMFIDLDHFKKINDTFGHQTGDEVLKITGQILLSMVRKTDYAGRYGGEEFLVIMPGSYADDAGKLAQRLQTAFAQQDTRLAQIGCTLENQQPLKVTASIGIATWEPQQQHPMTSVDVLVACADKAMYQAKSSGRNCVVCYSNHLYDTGH
ncbi:diguanylate cyclase (GGDEF) domain-containing protein [Allopseudospirillum japonicum]|uniref:diguanylate cyclase n=1 Tax=Allopseudospirillum japonicum TaxID=64971 RepID=A0A1H6T322_9GAMM|nr:GGDEF domain-containing protein [Allopseudospirillum japonicum]SEI74441.1 diguanylate cyclase (GGDEF) domain-containing protein [Allopseudospirillum japonicum]